MVRKGVMDMEISKARELLQVAIIRKKLQAGICEIAEKLIMSSGLSSRQVVDTLLDYECPQTVFISTNDKDSLANKVEQEKQREYKKLPRVIGRLCNPPRKDGDLDTLLLAPKMYDDLLLDTKIKNYDELAHLWNGESLEEILLRIIKNGDKSFTDISSELLQQKVRIAVDSSFIKKTAGCSIQEVLLICSIYTTTSHLTLTKLNQQIISKDQKTRARKWLKQVGIELFSERLHISIARTLYDAIYEMLALELRPKQESFLKSAILLPKYKNRVDPFRAAQTMEKKGLIPEEVLLSDYDEHKQICILQEAFAMECLQTICDTIIPLSEAIFEGIIPDTLSASDFTMNDHCYDILPLYSESQKLPSPYRKRYLEMHLKGECYWVSEIEYQEALLLSKNMRKLISTTAKGACDLLNAFEEAVVVKDANIYSYIHPKTI